MKAGARPRAQHFHSTRARPRGGEVIATCLLRHERPLVRERAVKADLNETVQPGPNAMNDEQAIRDLVGKWTAATRERDTATILRLMADDVVFLVPGREPFGKEAFAASAERMKGFTINGRSDIQELMILGDWAWMRNRLEVTITSPQGDSETRSGYTLTILRKDADGSWCIARDANLMT